MKQFSASTRRKWRLIGIAIIVFIVLIGASVLTFVGFPNTFAADSGKSHALTRSPIVTPTPTAPSGNSIGLSATSGPPGTHVFIAGSGFTPGENVQPIWGYGSSHPIPEQSFYYFNPVGVADATGTVNESLWVPPQATGIYTLAAQGTTSHIIKTATFQLLPSLDPGIYLGSAGVTLRLQGWSFGRYETLSVFWNWTPNNNGRLIAQATTDSKGDFSGRTYTVPSGTANGTYTLAGIGATSHAIAITQFTVGTVPSGPQSTASDWPNFGYDLQNTRVNPTETTIGMTNVATLAPKWMAATPLPYKIVGSPVIANGIAYIGTVEGTVSAYDIATGNQIWTFYTPGPVYGSPTIANGIAYFGSVNYPSEDIIGNYAFALNASTGSLIWDNYLANGGEWMPPLVANGRVFFSSAHKEGLSGGFNAFDVLTGAPLWSFYTPYSIWSPDTMDPSGTNLYVGTGNICDGPPGGDCGAYLEDLNPANGSVKWQIQIADISGDDDIASDALYSNGVLYIGTKNGIFYSVNAINGHVLWQYNTGAIGDSGIYSSATISNGLVFFGTGSHHLLALNISDGSLAWTFTAGSNITASPSIANGILYIGSVDKHIYALNPLNGTKMWSYNTGTAIWSSPVVSQGILYEASGNGYLYAFTPGGI